MRTVTAHVMRDFVMRLYVILRDCDSNVAVCACLAVSLIRSGVFHIGPEFWTDF